MDALEEQEDNVEGGQEDELGPEAFDFDGVAKEVTSKSLQLAVN